MPDEPRVSVCMATYNGANYVVQQLESILSQLAEDDEVVVVDDASADDTVNVVRGLRDPRVRVRARNRNLGYVRTFEEAIRLCRGTSIFLADQDDVWLPGRVAAMREALCSHAIVASNLLFLDRGDERPAWWMSSGQQTQWRRNMLRVLAGSSGYYGCGMALRRAALPVVLPFPDYLVESHDLWLGLAGNVLHSIAHLEEPTLRRRVHAENVTPERARDVITVLRARVMLLRAMGTLRSRSRRLSSATRARIIARAE